MSIYRDYTNFFLKFSMLTFTCETKFSLGTLWSNPILSTLFREQTLEVYSGRIHPFKTSANFHKFLTPTSLPSAVFWHYPSANLANF